MNRVLTIVVAGVIVFGGWHLLKAKVFMPARSHERAVASAPPARKVRWTPDDSDDLAGGDDPRAVFAAGLNRYLGLQVAGASALSLDRIDPTVISMTDDHAHVAAMIRGIRYDGRLEWRANGWELVEISR